MPESVKSPESIIINAVRDIAKQKGCEHFIFLFSPREGEMFSHLEQMQMDVSVKILVASISKVIEDISKDKRYTDEYRESFKTFLTDLKGIIKTHNERIKNLK